jgi:hypothetical protein
VIRVGMRLVIRVRVGWWGEGSVKYRARNAR